VLYDHAYLARVVGRLHHDCVAGRRAYGAGKTMQYSAAIRSARALVVLAPNRWTKMLVRRQNSDFEISVAVVRAIFSNTRICGHARQYTHAEAQGAVRLASIITC
jgi:hypothetical protein